ncbi:MAG: LysE family translocator [Brevundimonas sp.]
MSALPVDPGLYLTFLGVMAVMAATPGPANIFAVATGMARGPRAALAGVAGMNAATLVWFAAAALGLGALIAAFPAAFRIISILGAVYVGWLGLSAIWRARRSPDGDVRAAIAAETPSRSRSALVDGFMVQILNPKAVLFFTAVLPPFLDLSRPAPPQLGLFALGTIGLDVMSMSAYGLGGAALALWMSRPGFRRAFDLFTGGLLILAAILILTRL